MSKRGLLTLVFATVIGPAASPCLSALDRAASATAPASRPAKELKRLALTQPATTSVATTAASGQPGAWTAPALSGDYAILSTRSIFLHGRPPAVKQASSSPSTAPAASGAGLVLRGVARQGERQLALVEDLAAKYTRQIRIGDAIGGGKVVAITTDGFDSSRAGKISHVKIGQKIENGIAMAVKPTGATTQPALAQEGATPSTAPAVVAEQSSTNELPVAAGAKILPDNVVNH